MKRQARRSGIIKPVFWLTLICLTLWGMSLQTPNVSAQSDEETPSPTLESTATMPPEESQPTSTDTADATFTAEPTEIIDVETETATSLPAFTDTVTASVVPDTATESVVPKKSIAPIPTDEPPALMLAGEYIPDEILVKFKKNAAYENILDCISSANGTVSSSIEELNIWVVQVPFGEVAESIAAISACPEVRYAEPNYTASIADTIPSDPNWNLQEDALIHIHAPQGWDLSTGSSAVTIAIVDTGVDLNHADLSAKIVPGHNSINNASSPQDDNGHGTSVAGIAAASSNNGIGMAGVSWGARIMPVKVLGAGGSGNVGNVAEGITWAADNGAQVINLSLGVPGSSATLQDAVNYAYLKGCVIVAAAGNDRTDPLRYPAQYPHVIAVGAVDNADNRALFSNFGSELDLMAPGISIYSTDFSGGYGWSSGTSMSAPFVSGLAAILRGYPAGSSPDAIEWIMESAAKDLGAAGRDDLYGYGLIQMDAALKLVVPPTATPAWTFPPAPIPASAEKQFSAPGIPYNFIATVTNTNTALASPTNTSTLLPPTIQPTVSAVSDVQAVSIQQEMEIQSQRLPAWQLPCAGLAFLLAGVLLLWTAQQRR